MTTGIRACPPADRGRIAKLIFSAKESCYKAQYHRHRWPLDFPDVDVTLFPGKRSFQCKIRAPNRGPRFDLDLRGRYRCRQGLIATAVILEKPDRNRA